MQGASWVTIGFFVLDWCIRVGLSLRIISRRRPVGVSLAWLTVVLIFPFAGAIVYLMFGELRLGRHRVLRAANIHESYQPWMADLRRRNRLDWSLLGHECESVARLAESAVGIPALSGNELSLLQTTDAVFDSLLADIEKAHRTCHLEFYIWSVGGRADDVAEALIRAAARGVTCRVLLDDLGSREFLKSEMAAKMRQKGVALHAALPAGLLNMLFVRIDLRLHRKIVVIDGEIAYTGSMNLVDPRFFKQEAGVGQWVDAMVRMRGPSVEPLAVTFLEDWELETREELSGRLMRQHADRMAEDPAWSRVALRKTAADVNLALSSAHRPQGPSLRTKPIEAGHSGNGATSQVIPSGPLTQTEAIQQVLLMAIYAARTELVLTTPYFVPDEAMLNALISAARRNVDVTLIVPERNDSMLVRLASQAFQGDLLAAGVRVVLFADGLLHTKSVTVDGRFSLFGSLNLDPRSLQLNFEITLAAYDSPFTEQLRALQQSYIDRSDPLDLKAWLGRSRTRRFAQNAARLVGPLL